VTRPIHEGAPTSGQRSSKRVPAKIRHPKTLLGKSWIRIAGVEAGGSEVEDVAFGVDVLGADGGTFSAEGAVPDAVGLDGLKKRSI